MPQMSPMNWIYLYLYFYFIMMMIMIMFYNIYMLNINNINKKVKYDILKFKNKW